MLKLLGSLCVISGGALAWYVQRSERRQRRTVLADFQMAFRRMGEEIRMARTPLPALLETIAMDCSGPTAAFFIAASRAAGSGEELPRVWREQAEALPLGQGDRAVICDLVYDLQGDEEKVCKAISHVTYRLAKSAGEAERRRPEEEKRATALWFSAAALLVILLV